MGPSRAKMEEPAFLTRLKHLESGAIVDLDLATRFAKVCLGFVVVTFYFCFVNHLFN